jgi:hypothetical protein
MQMNATRVVRIAAAAVLVSSLFGCSATEKSSGKSSAGMRMPGSSLFAKNDDESLRKAVEKDPFPRAQGTLATANADKSMTR